MKGIYGKKVGMTRMFLQNGESVPVTVLEIGPNTVFQVKTAEKDGYAAVQIGFGSQKPQRVNRAKTNHFGKAAKGMPEHAREIRLDLKKGKATEAPSYEVGQALTVDGLFKEGDRVDIVGTSIGKGYAGVLKRHHMSGFPGSHGTHEYFRHGGSIGCRKFPGRVFKNKRMAGHMGHERVTQIGLEVIQVRPEENMLIVKGSVPGPKRGYVFVRESVRG